MSLARYRPSRRAVFFLMLLFSVVTLLLPPAWTDPAKHVVQFLVPAQHLTRAATLTAVDSAAKSAGQDEGTPELDLLTRELAAQKSLALELQEEIDRLRALRAHQLPPAIPLLDAKVVARDVVDARDSMLVARGTSRSVNARDWVASYFFVDRGAASAIEQGQAVLSTECLLGRVEQVSPYMSRVQLFTDVDSPRVEVRIAAQTGGSVEFIDYVCSLRGIGRGRMAIENVESRYVQPSPPEEETAPRGIRVGDMVFSAPGQLGLPSPMAVGKIVELKENPQKRLVYDLIVEPLVSAEQLRDVFIVPIVPVETMRIP